MAREGKKIKLMMMKQMMTIGCMNFFLFNFLKVVEGKNLKNKKPKTNKPVFCIYFFGSNNFAWIDESSVKPYETYKEQLSKTCKTAQFRDACAQIEQYIQKKAAGEPVDDLIPEDGEGEGEEEEIGEVAAANSTASGGEDNVEEKVVKKVDNTFFLRLFLDV